MKYVRAMKNLFKYLKRLSGKDEWQNTQRYRQIPDIATLKREHGYFEIYVVYDGEKYHVIDADGNCIEMCRNFREIKTELLGKKLFIM